MTTDHAQVLTDDDCDAIEAATEKLTLPSEGPLVGDEYERGMQFRERIIAALVARRRAVIRAAYAAGAASVQPAPASPAEPNIVETACQHNPADGKHDWESRTPRHLQCIHCHAIADVIPVEDQAKDAWDCPTCKQRNSWWATSCGRCGNCSYLPQERNTAGQAHHPPSAPAEPVAWMFPRRYGSGLSFKRPADYEDAEGNIVRPTPLYTIGGQGHEAAARCSITSIASSEATCLNTEPSGRIGSDIQQGKLDADAGSIPAPPTPSPDPAADDLVGRLRGQSGKAFGPWELCLEAAARIAQDGERINELEQEVQIAHMACRDKDADWVTENARAKGAEAEVAKLRRVVEAAKAMRNYPDARKYIGTDICDAFDAAIADLDKP